MAYVIVGTMGATTVTLTRMQPAPAIVVADRLVENGYRGVRVGWDGDLLDLDTFRAQWKLTRNGMKPCDDLRSKPDPDAP